MNSTAFPSATELRLAHAALHRCRAIGTFSDEAGRVTRTFLGESMRECHSYLASWMHDLGMQVDVDPAGNLRGLYAGTDVESRRFLIGSHLDTVPDAGLYDGVLGVVLAISLVEALHRERLPFAIEVIGFSEEEGIRFGVPFIGSRALAGSLDEATLCCRDHDGISIEEAIGNFGLDPCRLHEAVLTPSAAAYLEFHVEQGPMLESLDAPLGVVEAIVGQSRAVFNFRGKADHAGTTPMHLRQDALCAVAQWISFVEAEACATPELLATVGKIEAKPGAANVVPGEVTVALDVRHRCDSIRCAAFKKLISQGEAIARARGLSFDSQVTLEQSAVAMNSQFTDCVAQAIEATGTNLHRMVSGAGHDAMVVAARLPSAMVFLRSPGGVSHNPAEAVQVGDVALALRAGLHLLRNVSQCSILN